MILGAGGQVEQKVIYMQSWCAFMCVVRVHQLLDGHEASGVDCLVVGEAVANRSMIPGMMYW